jgi:hypothetical protein
MTASQLDYEPAAHTRRRRRRKFFLVSSALIVLIGLAVYLGPSAWRHLKHRYWLHAAENYSLPTTCVVYEEDPARTTVLLNDPNYQNGGWTSPGWMPYVARVAPPLRYFTASEAFRGMPTPLFLHARSTPSGQQRLVFLWPVGGCIRPDGSGGSSAQNQTRVELIASVYDGSNVTETRVDLILGPVELAENPPSTLYLRFFAGQPDPSDPTHFTVPYELGDYHDTLDARVLDDGSVHAKPTQYKGWQPGNPLLSH